MINYIGIAITISITISITVSIRFRITNSSIDSDI